MVRSFPDRLRQIIQQDIAPRLDDIENRLLAMEKTQLDIASAIKHLTSMTGSSHADVHGALQTIGLEIYDHHNRTRAVQSRLDEASTLLDQRVNEIADLAASRVAKTTSFVEAHEKVIHQVNYTNHNLYLHLREAMRVRELYYRDVMLALDKTADIYPKAVVSFSADKPIAVDTDDHLKPWGAAHDNTRLPRFAQACERHFGRPLTFMDLGCSGGGLVLDFVLRGHRAFGIEGSDSPFRAQRAEWRVLKHNLFTADITKSFSLLEEAGAPPIQCDVISMWEVMEHIADQDLEPLFANILRHLKPDGIFVGSIALGPDDHGGASYHRTVKPQTWWQRRYEELGMRMTDDHDFAFEDYARGTGNGPIDENYRDNPASGFHFVAVRKELDPILTQQLL